MTNVDSIEEDFSEDEDDHHKVMQTEAVVHVNANEMNEDVEMDSIEEDMSIENNVDDLETVHSADTDSTNFISITEKPLNLFKNQLIIKEGNKEEIKTYKIFNKLLRNVTIDKNTNMINLMKQILPTKGLVVIYIKNLNLFLKFQDLYREYFAKNALLKILKTNTIIKNIEDKEELLKEIENTHLKNNHRGITEVFNELKSEVYHPNLLKEINKYINNCEICQVAKFDRKPIKHSLNITETPTKQNQIVHFDIWFPQRGLMYLTSIDRFSKYATAYPLKDRTWVSIIEGFKSRTQYLGKPEKIIIDNEINTVTIKEYLKTHNIQYHVTTAYNKTGNSDVERLHSTLNEHIRLYNADQNNDLDLENKVHDAILAYNNTIHTTHNRRPIDFLNNTLTHEDLQTITKIMNDRKIYNINRYNKRHNNVNKNNFENKYVKNYRVSKSQPKYKTINNFRKQNNHLLTEKNKKYYKTQVKRKYRY